MEALTPKDPDADAWYFIDWEPRVLRPWQPDWRFVAGTIIRPGLATGWLYEATNTGKTGAFEEGWPTTPGVTCRNGNGSIVWITRDPEELSLAAITTSVWTLPTGITEVANVIDKYVTSILLNGGTAGASYAALNRITFNGLPDDLTLTVPMAHA